MQSGPKRRGRDGGLILLIAALLGLLLAACDFSQGEPVRVVLISLDTLRYDQLPATIEGPSAMPLTAARARRGVRFERFYASTSITQPSHVSMFTGLHPWEHGVTRNGIPLSERIRTLAEMLEDSGFETKAVVASFPLTSRFGFARGFDSFVEDFDERFGRADVWEKDWQVPGSRFFTGADSVSTRAIQQIDQASASKQFFWFHYFDPHSPYGSSYGHTFRKPELMRALARDPSRKEELLGRARRGYGADVKFLDTELDRLFTRLERDAAEVPTHIVVVADHGESLGEGGSVGHGSLVSEEQLHVPAFILSPGLEPSLRSDVSSSIDIAHTLLALAGVEPKGTVLRGRDLTKPPTAPTRAFAMRKTFHDGKFKDVRLDGVVHVLEGSLFCQIDGDGQMHRGNAAGLAPDESAGDALDPSGREEILARFRRFEEELEGVAEGVEMDEETRRGLKALGYLE